MTAVGFAFFLGSLTAADGSLAVHDRRAALEPLRRRLRAHAAGVSGRADRLAARAQGAGRRLRARDRRPGADAAVRRPRRRGLRRLPAVGDLGRPATTRCSRSSTLLTSAIAVVLVGYVLYVLVQRWQAASQPQRRAMAPVLWSGICLLVVLAGPLTTMAVNGPDALENATGLLGLIFFAVTPYGFLFGLLRSRVVQAGAVSELLHRMGDAPDGTALRELLSRRARRPLAAGRLLARGLAPLGRRRPAARPRCPRRTTRRAPGPRSSARAAASARSCTTARCARTTSWSARSPSPPACRSRTSACRRSCARASRSCAARAPGSSRPARPSAAGSSATCTTAPSSGSSRCR